MKLVIIPEPGVLELNYMWLPTWIGINTPLKQELEGAIRSKLVGKELTSAVIDEAHDLIVEFFSNKFPNLVGLRDYLDSLKFVQEQ